MSKKKASGPAHVLPLRFLPEQMALIEKLAAREGKDLAPVVREAAMVQICKALGVSVPEVQVKRGRPAGVGAKGKAPAPKAKKSPSKKASKAKPKAKAKSKSSKATPRKSKRT